MEMLQGVWKQHLRLHAVVGYGVKIFLPSPPNYVTRSPGNHVSISCGLISNFKALRFTYLNVELHFEPISETKIGKTKPKQKFPAHIFPLTTPAFTLHVDWPIESGLCLLLLATAVVMAVVGQVTTCGNCMEPL